MKKISYDEFMRNMINFNEENNYTTKGTDKHIYGVIVFKEESFTKPYTEHQRSYKTSNDNKGFLPNNISNSIFGDCLDGTDNGVRLDWYMYGEDAWKIDYCYMLED